MKIINKDIILFLLFGFFIGVVGTTIAGVGLYRHKMSKRPKRYDGHYTMGGSHSSPGTDAAQSVKLKKGFDIFTASALDRIFKDGRTLTKPSFSDRADISLARHEYESFQVAISNGSDELKDVYFEVSDLVHTQTGVKIAKEHFTWRVVGYVPTKKPYYAVKYVGLWPDPLMPAQKVNIPPGITQPYWFTLYAPKDTKAGIYEGMVTMTSLNHEPVSIPVRARVRSFFIPVESHLKTAFDLYTHITPKRYPKIDKENKADYQLRMEEMNIKYTVEMLKLRMNPILNVDPESQKHLGLVDYYRKYGLNNFAIGKYNGSAGNNWPKDEEKLKELMPLYRTYGELLALNKFTDYHYIYTWDEGDIGNPRVKNITSMIHEAHPKLKNMVCYHGFWDPLEYPGWGDDIDIWCFGISDFDQKKMDVLRDRGMEMWVYISGPSDDGAPNLAIDFDSIDYRIIPWLCWKYNIKGFLYWCVNWWPYVDPFLNAKNTKWEQNGNGLLFYPGEDGPINSLRGEIYRDGMEDYEYLSTLKELRKAMKLYGLSQTHQKVYEKAGRLLDIDKAVVSSMRSFTKDTQVLTGRRDAVGDLIEDILSLIREKTKEN